MSFPRPVLVDFAREMEQVLVRNDFKGCWSIMSTQEKIDKLHEELAELEREVELAEAIPGTMVRVQFEAIDLALCSMFFWDNARGASASQNRGRS